MERGHLVEEIVWELYPTPYEQVGFIKKNDWIGISPDGVILENWKIKKAIEIKSPEIKNSIRYWMDDTIPDEYHWQIVHYFVVIDTLESVDFLVCNPDIEDDFFRLKVKTITREELSEDIEKAKEELVSFRELWMETMQKFISLKTLVW